MGFQGEKPTGANLNSVRGFDVIDNIKGQVESTCKGIVSCADILSLAARDAVVLLNGPTWAVLLGRRDSRTASPSGATNNIPSPASTLSQLIAKFQAQGLSITDMTALAGAHTIGQARCTTFKQRLYNASGAGDQDPTMDTTLMAQLKQSCPANGGDNNLSPLDVSTPSTFDNLYFANLQSERGLLFSDQVLFSSNETSTAATAAAIQRLIATWAFDKSAFFCAFTAAMITMGNINPITDSSGEIRINCRLRN
ncbi:hypothetical protein KP509_02G027900 [Ceratopteris richardii]|nr:hypothetical protein KP509_02G027900 [Ceratopteris richardii]